MRLLLWLGIFAAALASAVIGIFVVLPFGLVVHELVILPLALLIGGLFASAGASWAGTRLDSVFMGTGLAVLEGRPSKSLAICNWVRVSATRFAPFSETR